MQRRGFRRQAFSGAVYVLPNLITTGNLFFGFFSIVKCLQGDFAWAWSAIILAAVFDSLDGSVARLTRGTSEFGVQYDSLCDLVSFGLAPAFLMYQFGLRDFGRAGWIICFLFLACGALRLARFNVLSTVGKASGDFTGLPIPMAAAVIACFIGLNLDLAGNKGGELWLTQTLAELWSSKAALSWSLATLGLCLALLMVSSLAYRSHKSLQVKGIRPFRLLVGLVVVLGFIAFQPELFGFAITAAYAVSGPLEWALGWKKAADDDAIFEPMDDGVEGEFDDENGTTQLLGDSARGQRLRDIRGTPPKEPN